MSQISAVGAREILDSRGRPTVEAELVLDDGQMVTASVPSGASTGRHEARERRDGGARYDGFGVQGAVAAVGDEIAKAVVGTETGDQAGLDEMLRQLDGTPDKSRLGANAILAASLAYARASAAAVGQPLWAYLSGFAAPLLGRGEPVLPMPMVNLISGGAHARQVLAFQDFLIIPVAATSYSQALESVVRVYRATEQVLGEEGLSTLKADEGGFGPDIATARAALDLACQAIERAGFRPGDDVALALDVAASQFSDPSSESYLLAGEDLILDRAGMAGFVTDLARRYPIVSIEDPLDEDDWASWTKLTQTLGDRVQLVGDDLFVTDPGRLARGIEAGAANAVLVKMNQIGTISETLQVVAAAREAGYATVVSARSGETEDPALADLAVATAAGQIKIGSVAQSERLAKYNQLLRIEEALGGAAAPFAGWPPPRPKL